MKRSEINSIIKEAVEYLESLQIYLPPWAKWSPEKWRSQMERTEDLRRQQAGWDISGAGSSFEKDGLVLFTLRNGIVTDPYKPYAEKYLIQQPAQVCPFHYHLHKMEDIINRNGGTLALRFRSSAVYPLKNGRGTIFIDGIPEEFIEDQTLRLRPGQSVTIPRGLFHSFETEDKRTLIGEVSTINDDLHDNYFLEENFPRFPSVEEDEEAEFLLMSDYAAFFMTEASGAR